MIMKEEFVKNIFETIVKDGILSYKELYDSVEISDKTIDYWKNSLHLYRSLDEKEKELFIQIIKQTIIDTISTVFGVFDGSCSLNSGEYIIHVNINGEDTENELQDCFLEYVENNDSVN